MAITTGDKEKFKMGVVYGCERLNVRSRPSSKADIVNIIDSGMKVSVDSATLSNKYYRIEAVRHNTRPLPDETITGYCLSDYIRIEDGKKSGSNEAGVE